MWDNLIGRQIRRSTRNLFLWNSLLLLGIVAGFVVTSLYWYNFALGPFPISVEQIGQLQNTSGMTQYFVTVSGRQTIDTTYREISTKKKNGRVISETETAKYLFLVADDQLLPVKAKLSAPLENQWTGTLDNLSATERVNVLAPIESQLVQKFGVGQIKIASVMVDASNFRLRGWIALGVAVPLSLLGMRNILKAVARFSNPEKHPLAKTLLKYGDPQEIAAKIEEECQSEERQQIGKVTFTRSWMVHPTTFRVDLIHLGDAAWVYKLVTQHYTNGVPTGKTFAAVLCDVHGTKFNIALNEAQTEEFVAAVLERVPWVLAGFDADLDSMWKKNHKDVVNIAEARRRQFAEDIRKEREAPEVTPADEEPPEVTPA